MLDWSKSYEVYLGMNEKQRIGIMKKCHEILYPEISNLVEEEVVKPALYLMSIAPFMSLSDEFGKKEYQLFMLVSGYNGSYERFCEAVKKGKEEKIGEFLRIYFQKVGGEVLTAYLSLGLAFLTIKGEISQEEKELIESIHG